MLLILLFGIASAQGHDLFGTLTEDRLLTTNESPYRVTSYLVIPPGVTLSIEAGAEIQVAPGVDIDVLDGGRILAEGTAEQPITFAAAASSNRWGRIRINGSIGSPENRFVHVRIGGNGFRAVYSDGATILMDHVTFLTPDVQHLALDYSSFVLSHCYFPSATIPVELVHGIGGIKPGGRGIIRRCFFGSTLGYNDALDFTGGNRPGDSILQLYNNVFVGSSDDILDLDGTDAWIENNIFLHCHKNGAADTAAAISGGNSGTNTSELTILNNIIFDCDEAGTAKQGNFSVMLNNTIVHITKTGGVDTAAGVVCVRDLDPFPTTFGKGFFLAENIVTDVEQLARNYDPIQTTVLWMNNILPFPWDGPGAGNLVADPGFTHVPTVLEASFNSWDEAQVIRDWFSLNVDSPARSKGANGADLGFGRSGVRISGEPNGMTGATMALLHVFGNHSSNLIGSTAWPNGAGYTHYKWRLDRGAWSEERSILEPILVTNLGPGTYQVEVIGKNDAGMYQNDPVLGEDAVITESKRWIVERGVSLRVGHQRGGPVEIRFTPEAETGYILQQTTSLDPGTWIDVMTITPRSTIEEIRVPLPTTLALQEFFRVLKQGRWSARSAIFEKATEPRY